MISRQWPRIHLVRLALGGVDYHRDEGNELEKRLHLTDRAATRPVRLAAAHVVKVSLEAIFMQVNENIKSTNTARRVALEKMAARRLPCQCRRAKCAPARRDRNLAHALGTFLCGRVGRCFTPAHARHQFVDRQDNEEVNRRADQNELDQCVDELSNQELAVIDGKRDGGKIGLADDSRD